MFHRYLQVRSSIIGLLDRGVHIKVRIRTGCPKKVPPDLDQMDRGVHIGIGVSRRTDLQVESHPLGRGVHTGIVAPGTNISVMNVC